MFKDLLKKLIELFKLNLIVSRPYSNNYFTCLHGHPVARKRFFEHFIFEHGGQKI